MDNVIQFPKKRNDLSAAPVEMEDVENKILNLRHHHINETLTTIIPSLFASMESSGFLMDDPDENDSDIKDGAFVVEAIRSLLCKHYGISHPFQKIADKVFAMVQDGEDTKFVVVDKLNIKLNTDK
jgi:hypothetical protein